MLTTEKIMVHKTVKSRLPETDFSRIDFGKTVSDHMLVSEYNNGQWHQASIMPYGHISLSPTALSLHYGQTAFEGMKAFKTSDGSISIFRIEKHYHRFCRSLERLCMPPMSLELFRDGLLALIATDHGWVPGHEGSALYIRPFVFASNEERFGVHESEEYKFMIFTGPVGPYYSKPLRVKVEDHYMRATHGGTGFAKCGGNYGASFYPTKLARQQGFDQVLWTDGTPELNIEESGTMNVMFVINGVLVTPPLSDTILDGVTRDSYLTLAKDLGIKTEERKIGATELAAAIENGSLHEAFGSGTAAVAAPIQVIHINGKDYSLPALKDDSIMNRIKKMLGEIRSGKIKDIHNWNTIVGPHAF